MSLNLTFIGAPLPVTQRGAPTKVYVGPDGDTLIYGNKTAVVARSVTDPVKPTTIYTQHRAKVTAAQFSPNGNYVASADESGKVRVWAFTHEEHLLKKEISTLSRGVRDIAWDGEGKRIAISGDGENKGMVFSWDTGSELGKMTGMTAAGCAVAFKTQRPYRVVVGCEDKTVYFFSGPPFKVTSQKKDHKNMVTSARFSADGTKFITVASDKAAFLYDGKSGEKIGKLSGKKKDRHNGTIYAVDFSPDSSTVFTVSSDKTCKLWDAGSGALINTLKVTAKPNIRDQQVGGCITAAGPVSVSLTGEINIFNPESPDAPARVIQGHQATPCALAIDAAGNPSTGCMGGVVCRWADGAAQRLIGKLDPKDDSKVHKGAVQGLAFNGGALVSVGIDGALNFFDATTNEITATENIGAPIITIATARAAGNVSVVITGAETIIALIDGKLGAPLQLPAEPSAVAIADDGSFAVVTLPMQRKMMTVSIAADGALTASGDPIALDGTPNAVAISPDKVSIAVSEGVGVSLYDAKSGEATIQGYWNHTGNVTSIDFSPNGQLIASGAKDSFLSVWKPSDKKFKCSTLAHFQGVIAARFANDDTIFSVGVDNCVRTHKFEEKAEE